MLTRQKILLKLLVDSGGSASRIKLVKLAFLLSAEGRSDRLKTFYEFLPYLYGPYSFTLDQELDNLLRYSAIKMPSRDKIEITTEGRRIARCEQEHALASDLEHLFVLYGELSQNRLIDLVYDKFPWFTANSAKPEKRKAKRIRASVANYTVGYQGLQVDGLLNLLLQNGIERLIDTRSNPVSRRYGFHKSTLSSLCKKVSIDYHHVPELGVPSEWRQELDTEKSYRNLFARYETEILDHCNAKLSELASDLSKKPAALLCRESDSNHCHRSRLAERLSAMNDLPIKELSTCDATAI